VATKAPIGVRDETVPSILLVDDRPANLLALEAILEPLGLYTVRASSGKEALKQLLKHDFALVLLDVQMPEMDGFETASAIRTHPRMAGIPIIFVTAINRDAAHVFKGYARGAVDYILKPFDPDILRAKVGVFVELWQKGETIKAQAKLLHEREIEAVERRSEQRFRRLTDLMPLLMAGTRPDGSIYYVNREWLDYTGLNAEQTSALDNPVILANDQAAEVSARWRESLHSGAPFEMQFRLCRASDKTCRWHLVRAIAEKNEAGVTEGWIATATDIDEQKQVEQVRLDLLESERAARLNAEAATRMKDEFLATVSHELRTPLHSILGWAQMMRSGMLDETRVQRALETIQRNAESQRRLIDDLLDVSRIVQGSMRIQRRRIDAVAVAQGAVETVRPSAETRGVALTLSFSSPAAQMWGDPDRIQQIIWNLVMNAVKFTPRGGHVDVSIDNAGDHVRLQVKDTGVGIKPEFLPHVFERFRQADPSTTRAYQGLGLGLAIVNHLVSLHEGKVSAHSEGEGHGATFTVTLPVRLEQTDEPEATWLETSSGTYEERKPASSIRGCRVLFVDDAVDALDLFKHVFEARGAKVITADCVQAALQALDASPFDVLVSDIGMQGEDGFDLIRQVREREVSSGSRRIPAVAVSGFSRTDEGQRALDDGFQVFLTKPVDPDELMSLCASLCQDSAPP